MKVLTLTALALLLAMPTARAQRGSDLAGTLLENAKQAELVDGKLQKAIGLYQQIVGSYAGERRVAAAALLGLARCYEQLGDARTRQTYERLISQYSDQTREVGIARTRLANLTPETGTRDEQVVVREVWSRPERYVTPANANNVVIFSDLAIWDSQKQEARRLLSGARSAAYPVVRGGMGPQGFVAYLSWSGDLQASLNQLQGDRAGLPARVELRVVGTNGLNDRALISSRDIPWLRPLAWSPDGDHILTDIERRDGTHDLALVAFDDGATRIVKSTGLNSPQEVAFSPDGDYVVYKLPAPRNTRRLEVHIVPVHAATGRGAAERRYAMTLGPELVATPTTTQQAIHVLNRLSFGVRPGDIERVTNMGIDAYIERQLNPEKIPDPVVQAKLAAFTSLNLSLEQTLDLGGPVAPQAFRPRANIFERRAMADRVAAGKGRPVDDNTLLPTTQKARRVLLDKHFEPQEIAQARMFRAIYSERQLFELMVDFWMNHFSINHGDHQQTAHFEEQVIRRHTFGKFEDLLMAVAKHPRMLNYLDNWRSSAPAEVIEARINAMKPTLSDADYLVLLERTKAPGGFGPEANQRPLLAQAKGLNENYARELMELHTLGVDGGYTQKDVIEVAKVLTGWTITTRGIVNGHEEDGVFGFDPLMHVEGDKVVLGQTIKSGGVEEGEHVIRMLAQHPSTARFIATKLARRFVADDPPSEVVEAAARTFQQTKGDIRQVLRTIVTSPQFRSADVFRAKIKKPLELVASALRATNAQIVDETAFFQTIGGGQRNPIVLMGERVYNYQSPDGNPDVASAYVNSNALLVRLEFANSVATGRFRGIKIDLDAAQGVLDQLGIARPTPQQIQQTRSMLQAAAARDPNQSPSSDGMMMMRGASATASAAPQFDPSALAVAAMLGSPQFQKR